MHWTFALPTPTIASRPDTYSRRPASAHQETTKIRVREALASLAAGLLPWPPAPPLRRPIRETRQPDGAVPGRRPVRCDRARIFNAPLGKELGQQVLVENLGGVSGALAAQKVLAAPADGYYIFQGSPNEVILSPLANAAVKLKTEDFRLVHPVADAVMVFVARKDLPVNSVDELIALARKSPDKPLTYGSVGIGSLYHLVMENVQQRTGIKLKHAPYKGNAPLLQDIGGGQVDFAVLVYSAAMGALAEQGRLKVIGQLGAQRSELLKNVPSVSEGKELKDFDYKTWSGFMVPKNTPEESCSACTRPSRNRCRTRRCARSSQPRRRLAAAPMSLAEAQQVLRGRDRALPRHRQVDQPAAPVKRSAP